MDTMAKSMSLRRTRHCLERALNLPITERMDDEVQHSIHKSEVSGGPGANVSVDQWRMPRTLCTLTWRDGTMGRGYITCREDSITESQRKQANEEWCVCVCLCVCVCVCVCGVGEHLECARTGSTRILYIYILKLYIDQIIVDGRSFPYMYMYLYTLFYIHAYLNIYIYTNPVFGE